MKTKFLFFLLLYSTLVFSQDNFPESWIGNYKGDVLIYSVDSVKMKVGMELNITKTKADSIFNWTIIYNSKKKKDIRNYKLIVIDRKKGLFQIDEKNSIVIEAYLHHKKIFTSFFKVMHSFLIASYTKEKNAIVFEIISIQSKPVSVTGKTKFNGEDIPEVNTYPIQGRQKAILFKTSNP